MYSIIIKTSTHFPVNKKKIKEAVERVLKQRLVKECEVSIVICGDRQMKKLNAMYRNINDKTDVLSFPQNDPTQPTPPFPQPPNNVLYLGDIVVSYPQAVKEAAEEHTFIDEKIQQLVLHGLDHLMGIHHDE